MTGPELGPDVPGVPGVPGGPGSGPPPLPLADATLRRAVPAVRGLLEDLEQALLASVTVDTPSPIAEALWQLRKAAGFLLDAADVPPALPLDGSPGTGAGASPSSSAQTPAEASAIRVGNRAVEQVMALDDAHDALQDAAARVRAGMAEVYGRDDLAGFEDGARLAEAEAGTAVVDQVTLTASVPDDHSPTGARTVQVRVDVDAASRAWWHSPEVDLPPVGPRRQIDLTEALRLLAHILTPALPDPQPPPT